MTIPETVLVFAGIPIGAFALVAAAVLGPHAVRAPRYRPGGAWNYNPVWYLPHPEHPSPVSSMQAIGARQAGQQLAIPGTVSSPVEASGGASGEW